MFACLLHAGYHADIVLIIVTGLSCTLSAFIINTLLSLVTHVLQTGNALGCLHVFLSWIDLSILATWLPWKWECAYLSYNFFSLHLLSFSLVCLFYSGNYFERQGFCGWKRVEGLLRQLYTSCEHPSCLFPPQSSTTFLHNLGITGAGENYLPSRCLCL